MSLTNPIPRGTREVTVITAPGQYQFGPLDFVLFDAADISLWLKLPTSDYFGEIDPADFTVTPGAPATAWPAKPIVTLRATRPAGSLLTLRGLRVPERASDVTRDGKLQSQSLERELDKQVATAQELRRDISRGVDALDTVESIAAHVDGVATDIQEIVAQLPDVFARGLVFVDRDQAESFNPTSAPDVFEVYYGGAAQDLVIPFRKVVSEPADLPAPAIIRLADGSWYRHAGKDFPLEIGASGDGLTDNSNFFEDLSGSLTDYRGVITAGRGQFKTKKPLLIPKDASLVGDGSGRSIIDAFGVTDPGTFPDWAVVRKVGGAPIQIGDLGLNPGTGDRGLVFAANHGLSRDDLLLLYNPEDYSYSPWRNVYRSGEFGLVRQIASASALYLSRGIYSDGEWSGCVDGGVENEHVGLGGAYSTSAYNKDKVDVYLCSAFGSGELRGFSVRAPRDGVNAGVTSIYAQYIRGLVMEDVRAIGGGANAIGIFNCYDVRGSRILARNEYNLSGADYGLVLANSQLVLLDQLVLDGERHAMAVGGANDFAIPCREIHASHSVFTSHGAGGVACADWHGNVEYSSFRGVSLFGGGVNLAGNHNVLSDIRTDSDNIVIYGRELSGLDHKVSGLRGRTTYFSADNGIIDVGGNNVTSFSDRTARGGILSFSDIELSAPNQSGRLMQIRNRGFVGLWSIRADSISFDAPTVVTASPAVLALLTVSGSPPQRVDIANVRDLAGVSSPLRLLGTGDNNAKVSGLRKSGVVSGVTSAASSVLVVDVAFGMTFPKLPHISVATHNSTTNGTDTIGVYLENVTQSGFQFVFFRTDQAANFSAAFPIKGSWVAALDE